MTAAKMTCVVTILLGGCGSTKMATTGPKYPARPPSCEFQILTAAPASGFVEVAAIDVNWGAYGSNSYRDLTDFKNEIRPYVCSAGGDAAIAYANGYGLYIKATVLKAVEAPQGAEAPTSKGADPVQANDTGCHYDTQCKGDRICVQGTCTAPTPAAAPSAP